MDEGCVQVFVNNTKPIQGDSQTAETLRSTRHSSQQSTQTEKKQINKKVATTVPPILDHDEGGEEEGGEVKPTRTRQMDRRREKKE